jgi:copper chaperone
MNDKKVIFKVNGIHCGGCANKIKTQIAAISSGSKTDVDVASGLVTISFPGNEIKVSDLKAKIISTGYEVESVELS